METQRRLLEDALILIPGCYLKYCTGIQTVLQPPTKGLIFHDFNWERTGRG